MKHDILETVKDVSNALLDEYLSQTPCASVEDARTFIEGKRAKTMEVLGMGHNSFSSAKGMAIRKLKTELENL